MGKSRFSEEQIVAVLQKGKAGATLDEAVPPAGDQSRHGCVQQEAGTDGRLSPNHR